MTTTLANISIKDSSSWNTYLNLIYPVGSVYISYTSTSPSTRFGGTWVAITGKFPYFNAGVGTGGSNTHTHSLTNGFAKFFMGSEIENQFSFLNLIKTGSWSGSGRLLNLIGGQDDWWRTQDGNISTHTTGTGLGGNSNSASTMPAYQTFYAWRRTA